MAAFFRGFERHIEVRAYVRAPVSFMQSVFQQRLKQERPGATDLGADTHGPRYRARFEKLVQVFGRERVHPQRFDPRNFPFDDIVLDFAEAIGVTLPADARLRANDGLSLEAMWVAFARQAGLLPPNYPAPHPATRFRSIPTRGLTGFGTSKFAFSSAFLAPAIAPQRADLDWIEARLGMLLSDSRPDTDGIGAADDFLNQALDNRDAVAKFVENRADPTRGLRHRLRRLKRSVSGRPHRA